MRRAMLIRFFALFMIVSYLWAFHLERMVLMTFGVSHYLFVGPGPTVGMLWYLLFMAPSLLYLLAALVVAPLILYPGLVNRWRYARLLAYALAPYSTAWISGSMLFNDELQELVLEKKLYFLWCFPLYPISYAIYAYLVYKVFDPILGDIEASRVSPRVYRLSTGVARILGYIFVALFLLAVVSLEVLGFLLLAIIYLGLGMYITGFSGLKNKPYRFLIAFPLIGQAVYWRTWILDQPFFLLLAVLDTGILPSATLAGVTASLLVIRWLLFPLPGFGGAQASLALSHYLYYKFYDKLVSLPTFITPLWLLGEWLIFYRALRIVYGVGR